jgi:hypothetical protein
VCIDGGTLTEATRIFTGSAARLEDIAAARHAGINIDGRMRRTIEIGSG